MFKSSIMVHCPLRYVKAMSSSPKPEPGSSTKNRVISADSVLLVDAVLESSINSLDIQYIILH